MESTRLSAPPAPHRTVEGEEHAGNGHASHGHGNGDAEHDRIDLNVPPARTGWVLAALTVIALVVAVLLLVGLLPRLKASKELTADAEAAIDAPVPVNVIKPRQASTVMPVQLPGTLRPWQEVSLFARTTGYLKKYFVDISNQVTKGQLMADIDAPDVDAQLRGAEATLEQQKAMALKAKNDIEFAKTTLDRFESLRNTNGVTKQELDLYRNNYNVAVAAQKQAEANVNVGEAEVKRLSEMQSFEKIVAPFSGVVTGRAYDVGAMILANPTSNDTLPMFKIAENDVLRAFVYVPQNYALTIEKGMQVKLTARERPGRVFTGTVMGTTNYLDPNARTLMTEVKVPNADLALLPGMYVDTTFEVKRDRPPMMIPAAALVTNADGNQVGLVKDGKVHFTKVQVGVDYGSEIEIVSGLNPDDQVIENPGERTTEGAAVQVAGEPQTAAGPAATAEQTRKK